MVSMLKIFLLQQQIVLVVGHFVVSENLFESRQYEFLKMVVLTFELVTHVDEYSHQKITSLRYVHMNY